MALDIDRVLAKLEEIEDPIEKIKAVGEDLGQIKHLTAELGRVRREQIEELISKGWSQNQIGREIGLTSSRMSQLLSSGPAPERAFFGAGAKPVIVAVGEKPEGGKAKPGPVASVFDMQAYEHLRTLVENLGFRSSFEVIKPPGSVRLNRDGLIIVCGPRLSPLIAQILEADNALGFDKDDDGWHLIDRKTNTAYRSAEDAGEPGDTAYLGRLPRPDGRGHFLYIAGIHAAGAAGVVHYLENELPSLHREVKNKRFSTLIACRYEPSTGEVIASERITPIYRHEG